MQRYIAVIGGDGRSKALAETLKRVGYQTQGFFTLDTEEQEALYAYLPIADAVILPANHMGGSINGLLLQTQLCTSVSMGTRVYTGRGDGELFTLANRNRLYVREFLRDEVFLQKNAALTAEAALALAITKSEGTLWNASCAVVGYGRIAQALLRLLRAFTPHTAAILRKEDAMANAELQGYTTYSVARAEDAFLQADYIFNTVPQQILSLETMHAIPQGGMYMELASSPGGCSADDVPPWVTYLPAPGLPGKISCKAAADIMAQFVLRDMEVGNDDTAR